MGYQKSMPKIFGEAPDMAASRETYLENRHFWRSARKGRFAGNIFEKITFLDSLVISFMKILIFFSESVDFAKKMKTKFEHEQNLIKFHIFF